MLTASFSCFKGLSRSAEQKIWELGCLSWDHFNYLPDKTFSKKKTASVLLEIEQAQMALKAGMPDYFLNRLLNPDKIRVLSEFQQQTAVIDIETTGLSSRDEITSIAVLKNGGIYLFVKGINLYEFFEIIQDVKLLITFNGTRFDLPFIRRFFSIDLGIPHLDLLPVLKPLGYYGGQKKCEKIANLRRIYSKGTTGKDAVILWDYWQKKHDITSLKQLILYNAEDVFMLEKLAIKTYDLVMKTFPIHLPLKSSISNQVLMEKHIKNNVL